MKRIFIFLALIFFLVGVTSPVAGVGFFEELFETIDLEENEEDLSVFSDPAYTQPTHNFSPGQTVYIRVESPIGGEKEKTLRLLDSEKREVQRLVLNQSGNLFTTSFAAPTIAGVYYVDIKIEDSGGSKFASQENINVGEVSGVPIESRAESTGQTVPTGSPTIIPVPTPILIPTSEHTAPVSLILRMIEFFQKLFSYLTGWFK